MTPPPADISYPGDFGRPSSPTAPRSFQFDVVESHDHAEDHGSHDHPTPLGFWIYLMTDCLIFGILFTVYAVLGQNYAAGPAPIDLFELDKILIATFALLFSSITYGFAVINMERMNKNATLLWLGVTGVFGMIFLVMSIQEFMHLWHIGATPMVSAFLSSFYFLVGTHATHVAFGSLWLVVLMVQLQMHGITTDNKRRVMCLSMFWHFLDLIWIGVFSFVYLAGVLL